MNFRLSEFFKSFIFFRDLLPFLFILGRRVAPPVADFSTFRSFGSIETLRTQRYHLRILPMIIFQSIPLCRCSGTISKKINQKQIKYQFNWSGILLLVPGSEDNRNIMNNTIKLAKQKLAKCTSLLIGTGAGMGRDSGLPDFRGNEGFWNNYPPYRNKFNFFQCANPDFLLSHPNLFWGFYGSRLIMYRQKQPHRGFHILKQISEKMQKSFIVTSNVDGHHQRAFDQNKIHQVHGSIHHLQCYNCSIIIDNKFEPEIDYDQMLCKNLPKCQRCSQNMRPNILMFGDWYWMSERSDKQQSQYRKFLRTIQPNEQLAIIQIGSGKEIPTIRNLCQKNYYNHKNSIFIRINPEEDESDYREMDKERYFHIKQRAQQALIWLNNP